MQDTALIDVLRPRLGMIAVLCLVATLAGYGFSFLVGEEYEAAAVVLVRPQESIRVSESGKTEKEFLGFPVTQTIQVETAGKTYIEIIKSTALVEEVVRRLHLDQKREKKPGFLSRLLPETLKTQIKELASILQYGRVIRRDDFEKAVGTVKDNLALESREDTYVFDITYASDDPERSADVANAAAESFIDYMAGINDKETNAVGAQLQKQLRQNRAEMEAAYRRLERFQLEHKTFIPETEYIEGLKSVETLGIDLEKLEADIRATQGTLSTSSKTVKRDYLRRVLEERKAALDALPEVERQMKLLELDVQVNRIAYEIVAKEVKEAEIENANPEPGIRLISRAIAPALPVRPLRGEIALIAFTVALVIGVGLAFLLEYLNRKVRGIDDLEKLVGMKVLATVPDIPRRRWRRAGL